MAFSVNAAFLAVIGATGFVATRNLIARQRAIAAWPTVTGRLLAKEAQPSPQGGYRYLLAVRYAYEVDGVSHESTQYAPMRVYSRRQRVIDKDLAALPEAPSVSYNPQRPDDAYLSVGPTFWPRVAHVLCALMVVLAGLMALS